ncbi:MAG: RNA-binding protein [Planctomycetes bacterium]|jgi:RNA recognition motif-containing protein|nr:RNA-binding protein [Planctomycetota bacterium]
MKIFVGNLSRDVTDADLLAAFEPFGKVDSAKVITEKFSTESRGFGFVEMPSHSEAKAAMDALNGRDLKARAMVVNEARPQKGREGGRR